MTMTDKKYHVLAGLFIAAAVGLPAYIESINLFAGLWPALTSGFMFYQVVTQYM